MEKNMKFLVVRYGTVGDTVFLSVALRELRKAYPNAQIDALVDVVAMNVLRNCPYVDNFIKIEGKYKNILSYMKCFKQYNTVYFFKSDSFFSKVAYLSGVKNRIGFGRTEYDVSKNHFLTMEIPSGENRHVVDCFCDMLMQSGVPVNNSNTELWTQKDDDILIKDFLSSFKGKNVLIQAYSRMREKDWLDNYWVKVIEYLINEKNVNVYLCGGKKDSAAYDNLLTKLGGCKFPPVNISGKFSLSQTMSLIKYADMLIGVDSGLMHIAAAFKKSSILINGSTSLKRWKPRNENCVVLTKHFPCSPCCVIRNANNSCEHKTPECMKALTPDAVINEINF